MGSTCRCSACSRLQVGSKLFMDILMTAQYSSRIGNQASILPKYWQPIPQKCSYMHLTSLEYFSVSLSGQGQQIIPDAVMFWDFTIASNSNVSGLMVIVLTLLIKCKWSFQLFLSKMNNQSPILPVKHWSRQLLEALDFICHLIPTFDLPNLNQVHKILVRL